MGNARLLRRSDNAYSRCCNRYGVQLRLRCTKTVSPNNRFTQKLKSLLAEYPAIDVRVMGFPADWENEPLWKA